MRQAVLAGVVTAVVGFTSSFAVVLAGLQAMGATAAQAGSGLMVLCLTMGLGCVLFAWRTRLPITMAWSTPGAALLASSATPAGGFATAVGAFVVAGLLLALCGLVRPLERAVEAIPTPVANAMLAGVLLGICVQPFRDLVAAPAALGPVVLSWAVAMFVVRRWAVPIALVVAGVVMVDSGALGSVSWAALVPRPVLVAPAFDGATMVAVGVPLWIVTMTSQNIPGMAVLRSFGYAPKLGPTLVYSGSATAVGAVFGGHAINLAAISAALAAGSEAHPDKGRRWVAALACGVTYLAFGPLSPAVSAVADAAPAGLLAAIAGLALVGTFASSAAAALAEPSMRDASALTFVVAASGVAWLGIGAAFWALVAGLAWAGASRWVRR